MEYEITPMLPAHLEEVEEIEKICFPEDPWSRRIFAESLAEPNTTNLVARTPDGGILGYISFTVILDEGGINNLAVRPGCREQGIASALLDALRRTARERRLAFLTLEVRPSNQSARRLYARHGYREVGRRKNYYEHPREDALIMTWELTNELEDSDPRGAADGL